MPSKVERNAAMDLLDALSRPGTLPLEDVHLHVVLTATHCFDKTLMSTVVQDNVNPIECVERSALIMASVIHGCPPAGLLKASQEERVREHAPMLFIQ
mmetsp:Transcript_81030/g.135513  ORF Transcript_81030/g.135513 Transcript_81030/m.135513 type:complete len:98 (-) Transcript_81030:386-679(-)